MTNKGPLFDVNKAKLTIERGARRRWWQRKGTMKGGFKYVAYDGHLIKDEVKLERIRALVIPPAWKHVRISPAASSRVQAVGMDTTGRIQYKYHAKFSEKKTREKFIRIQNFGRHLPRLRQVTNEHIGLDGFPRQKVLAVMMRLINHLYFRVGTDKSAKHYRTYGITTLMNKHFSIGSRGELIFDFVGKSHVQHRKILVDKELAALMKEIKELGRVRKLFHYVDEEGNHRSIEPADVNAYLKELTAPEFSAKDLRTWGGTLLAGVALAEIGIAETEADMKKNLVKGIRRVAEQLGNTPTVARGSYIHPAILQAYERGKTLDEYRTRKQRLVKRLETDYEPEEAALLKLLDDYSR
ncbi:MAG: hypothetical protein WKF34_08425 [Pyrinomonadaceae bacterium]